VVLTQGVELSDALDMLVATSCCRWQDDGTSIRFLLPGQQDDFSDITVEHVFRSDNVVYGSLKSYVRELRAVPRHLVAKFRDLDDPYLTETRTGSIKDEFLIAAYGDLRDERSFPNMTHSQAQRILAYQYRMENSYREIVELTGDGSSIHLLPGDMVKIDMGDYFNDGYYLVLDVTNFSGERTPDETAFRLLQVRGRLYSDSDHYVVQRETEVP
jgi:hypothetical protein